MRKHMAYLGSGNKKVVAPEHIVHAIRCRLERHNAFIKGPAQYQQRHEICIQQHQRRQLNLLCVIDRVEHAC